MVGGSLFMGACSQADIMGAGTPKTDFGPFAKSAILYFHGGNPELGRRVLSVGDIAVKDAGVWIEGQLALRDKYERAVKKLCDQDKLGWSSGTAVHLIERDALRNLLADAFVGRRPTN